MATVFIFHGVHGNPKENWFPWLKSELEKEGHSAIVPQFPHADRPQLGEWLEYFSQWNSFLDAETIFVGHSLGSAFALRLLESIPQHIRATFLIAPVWGVMENAFDPLMTSFTSPAYDWERIRAHAGKTFIFQSDNDPYIAPSKTNKLAEYLDTTVKLVRNGGHFNEASGYTHFEQLLRTLRDVLP